MWFLQEESAVTFKVRMVRQKNHPAKQVKAILTEGCLYMAQGALKAIRLSMLRAIQLAACRPYDALGQVVYGRATQLYQMEIVPPVQVGGLQPPYVLIVRR
jgi:hypothetical protein